MSSEVDRSTATQNAASNTLIELRAKDTARPLGKLRASLATIQMDSSTGVRLSKECTGPSEEFVSVGRAYGSLVGPMVLTPLDFDDGSTQIVARGIVPPDRSALPAEGYAVPRTRVVIERRPTTGEAPSRIGEPDPPSGHLEALSRLDLEFIDSWVQGDVLPFMLLLDDQIPESEAAPVPIPDEELTEGSHLGYAVQWFAFVVIAIVGLGALLYRAGRVEPGGQS